MTAPAASSARSPRATSRRRSCCATSRDAVAFLDARPVFKGHVLVVPRAHVATLPDLPPAGARRRSSPRSSAIARAVEAGLGADGTFVAMNNKVSQSVPHLHVHVVPRRRKDGLRGFFWPRGPYADRRRARRVRGPHPGRASEGTTPADGRRSSAACRRQDRPEAARALDFERPIVDLERKIEELVRVSGDAPELRPRSACSRSARASCSRRSSPTSPPWQKVQLSRHPARPYTLDYIERLVDGLRRAARRPPLPRRPGDRRRLRHVRRHAGAGARPPEGPQHQGEHAAQLRHAAARGLPQGAAPDGAGGALRAARSSASSTRRAPIPASTPRSAARPRRSPRTWRSWPACRCPIVCAVIGEGGSGGALALGVADRILMLEYSIYSVISPEGCASILWRDDAKKPEAAAALKMTAPDLLRLGIVDEIIPEAPGGAHRDHDAHGAQPGRRAAPPPGRAAAACRPRSCATIATEVPPDGRVRRVGRQGGVTAADASATRWSPRRCASTPATSKRW